MFAELVDTFKINEEEYGFLASNRTIGFGYKANLVDAEIEQDRLFPENCSAFVASMPENSKLRFISKATYENEFKTSMGARTDAIESIGCVSYRLFVFCEKHLKPSLLKLKEKAQEELLDLRSSFDPKYLKQLGLNAEPIQDYSNYFEKPSILRLADCGARADSRFFAILKLTKLGTYPIDPHDFINIRENLPLPNTVVTTIKKLSDTESQLFLRKKSKQEESGRDLVAYRKYEDAQKSIAEADLSGHKFVSIEVNILFEGDSEEQLTKDLYNAKNSLKYIGNFEAEIIGILPSLISARVAGNQHHSVIERDDKIQTYLPIYSKGSSSEKNYSPGEFVFHRNNESLCSLDPYATHNNNYSGIIIGQSGRGKSVFNNTLIRCLSNDPDTRIILVDVMGSYARTVQQLDGTIHQINSEAPSGISPFEFLRVRQDKAVIEILADYIEKLILEDGESSLKKTEQVELENALLEYVAICPKNPSLDSFVAFSKNFPRKTNIERWCSKGLFGNIFFPINANTHSRLQYFDFTEIAGASNGGLAKAVMSAVMAHFNFLLLNKPSEQKLIFICDETPFFIKNCFSSFTLLSKNVRKLSGSLILTAQMLSDLVVNGDTSLIAQSEFKILFSCDGSEEFYRTSTGLSADSYEIIKNMRPSRGDYSLFYFKDGEGERLCKLILTKEEYYLSTTHAEDKVLISKCKNAFNLDDELEAARAVSLLKEAGVI